MIWFAAGIIGFIAYYTITRAILLWYAVVIRGLDIDDNNQRNQYQRAEEKWRDLFLLPLSGEFWFWLAGPVVIAVDLSKVFSDKMIKLRKDREAKAVTKAKMTKMRDAQLELAEIQLDRELSQAKKDYQRHVENRND
mgnify:CR=1 FL=1